MSFLGNVSFTSPDEKKNHFSEISGAFSASSELFFQSIDFGIPTWYTWLLNSNNEVEHHNGEVTFHFYKANLYLLWQIIFQKTLMNSF